MKDLRGAKVVVLSYMNNVPRTAVLVQEGFTKHLCCEGELLPCHLALLTVCCSCAASSPLLIGVAKPRIHRSTWSVIIKGS